MDRFEDNFVYVFVRSNARSHEAELIFVFSCIFLHLNGLKSHMFKLTKLKNYEDAAVARSGQWQVRQLSRASFMLAPDLLLWFGLHFVHFLAPEATVYCGAVSCLTLHQQHKYRLKVSAHWVRNFRMRFFAFTILKIRHAQRPCTLSPMRIN